MVNWKGFGRKRSWLNQGTIPAFAWREWVRPRNPLRVADVSAEIRTNATATPASLVRCLLCGQNVKVFICLFLWPETEELRSWQEILCMNRMYLHKVAQQQTNREHRALNPGCPSGAVTASAPCTGDEENKSGDICWRTGFSFLCSVSTQPVLWAQEGYPYCKSAGVGWELMSSLRLRGEPPRLQYSLVRS
jgi:hypothetical protein